MTISHKSFGDFASESVHSFLYGENFPSSEAIRRGVVHLVDNISQYQEEGVRLRPECVVSTDIRRVAQRLPTHLILPIQESALSDGAFQKGLKSCAPLAIDGWSIYFEVLPERVEYGVLATGATEHSPSIYRHLKDALATLDCPTFVLRSPGDRTAVLSGRFGQTAISFSLQPAEVSQSDETERLAAAVSRDIDAQVQDIVRAYLADLLEHSSFESHGCLVVVVEHYDDVCAAFWADVTNGIRLPNPISLAEVFVSSQEDASRGASNRLLALSNVTRRMLSHDGALVLTSDGRVVGYNCFVRSNDEATANVTGGARSRAFLKLTQMPHVSCAFMRSHDGRTQLHATDPS